MENDATEKDERTFAVLHGISVEVSGVDLFRVQSLAHLIYGMTPCDDRKPQKHRAAMWSLQRAVALVAQLKQEASRVL